VSEPKVLIRARDIDAVIFDMDGVVTQTASLHFVSWKRLFDAYFEEHAKAAGTSYAPFTEADYLRYVDGKPRYNGVRDVLAARDIVLPWGDPSDPPEAETVCGLGNRKNVHFVAAIQEQGAEVFESTIDFIRALTAAGVRVAIISASKNATMILESAGVRDLFEAQIDGVVAAELDMPGKPAPDVFLEAARRLGVDRERAVVVEDAVSGVQAGRAGGFALVIGIDRGGNAEGLAEAGADVVIDDLVEAAVTR
jgi:beta-phosphoglucomutase family hydrolase